MHLPPVLTAIPAVALRLSAWLLLCVLCLMQAPAYAGEVHTFAGKKVKGCQLDGNAYTCGNLPSSAWDDSMAIANGYSVHVKSDVSPGWDYGLSMSGSARLTSSGSIDLTQINPAKISITGGSFHADGAFKIGGAIRVKADVNAGSLSLGTGPEFHITGNMVSRGAVAIAYTVTIDGSVSGTAITTNSQVKISGSVTATGDVWIGSSSTIGGSLSGAAIATDSSVTVNGAVKASSTLKIASYSTIHGPVSGTVVTTDSHVTLNGEVVATTRFMLESDGKVNGKVTAPEVELRAANSAVTGKVTAQKSLTLGSSARVNGDVDTGELKLEASEAIINGNAAVNIATLLWHGRVSEYIQCKKGATVGDCSCVNNQSGYDFNSTLGPKCGAAPPVSRLHHFRIEHDGQAQACSTENVKVIACANASCTETYTDGATVKLFPGGATVNIGNTSTALGQVSRDIAGIEALRLEYNGATIVPECRNGGSSSCDMNFAGGVGLTFSVPHHRAGNDQKFVITARQPNPTTKTCEAAFRTTKTLEYACTRELPTTGDLKPSIAGTDLVCDGKTRTGIATPFNDNGRAELTFNYKDVGRLRLDAGIDDTKTNSTFTVAPDHFVVKDYPTTATRAGDQFDVTVVAVEKNGATTPNFDDGLLAEVANTVLAAEDRAACQQAWANGTVSFDKLKFKSGAAAARAAWNEVGKLDLKASLDTFLDSGLKTVGTTRTASSACSGTAGPFIPKYFMLELVDNPARSFYYAGEEFPVRVSARSAGGEVTANYSDHLKLSEQLVLGARDNEDKKDNPEDGILSRTTIGADLFSMGQAEVKPTYTHPAKQAMAPTTLRLRARNAAAVNNDALQAVTSATDKAHEVARPLIRTGRLRINNRFGYIRSSLDLQLRAEYWTGSSWALHAADSRTTIKTDAIARTFHGPSPNKPALPPFPQTEYQLANGVVSLPMSSTVAGWIDVAINLGPDTGKNLSCLADQPTDTPGAALPWLRSLAGCADPSGRATFGIFEPENRRIIHMREVFN
ncbi:DUF6701 domain-containing protein [Massilia sp. HP4]|uniref:DUF6701 domain-containing protein n=1 Tax=Massilia sp. HP4 TaxID=2562316 RepID=UPI0010BF8696|nr:DUF6701 domain-containing protein [Massilia sp. HP4]